MWYNKFQKGYSTALLTTVEPIATPAAVEAICPKSPGCCGAGCATLEAGLTAGTLETGFGRARFEDSLSPRGICDNLVPFKNWSNLAVLIN